MEIPQERSPGRRVIGSSECPMTGDVTVFLDDDTAFCIDRHTLERSPLEAIAASYGASLSNDRTEVVRNGRKIGEMPAWWHPGLARSSSAMYDYRPGDLTMRDGRWHAANNLGGRDLDCLIGFVRKDGS